MKQEGSNQQWNYDIARLLPFSKELQSRKWQLLRDRRAILEHLWVSGQFDPYQREYAELDGILWNICDFVGSSCVLKMKTSLVTEVKRQTIIWNNSLKMSLEKNYRHLGKLVFLNIIIFYLLWRATRSTKSNLKPTKERYHIFSYFLDRIKRKEQNYTIINHPFRTMDNAGLVGAHPSWKMFPDSVQFFFALHFELVQNENFA